MSTTIIFSFGQVRKQTDAENKLQCYHISPGFIPSVWLKSFILWMETSLISSYSLMIILPLFKFLNSLSLHSVLRKFCFTELTLINYLCFLIIKLISPSVKMLNKYCQRMTWNCEKEIQAIYVTTLTVVEHISTHSLTVNKFKWKQWKLSLTSGHH